MRYVNSLVLVFGILFLIFNTAVAARIVSATFCEDVQQPGDIPIRETQEFRPASPAVHAVIEFADMDGGTQISSTWFAADCGPSPNYEISSEQVFVEYDGPATAHFFLTRPDAGWPVGNFYLVLHLDGESFHRMDFKVTAQAASPSPGSSQAAGPYNGTFRIDGGGDTTTLSLQTNGSGELTGTLSSTTGAYFELEGSAIEGGVGGVCTSSDGAVFFEAYFEDETLYFGLIEPDGNNMPDYDTVRVLPFTRSGGSRAQGNTGTDRIATAQTNTRQQGGGNGIIGSWQGNGVSLSFDATGVVEFDGEESVYELRGNTIQVQSSEGVLEFPFELRGSTLTIDFAQMGGGRVDFQRVAGAATTTSRPASQYSDEQLKALLTSSRWCAYGFSSGGGYSSSGYTGYRFLSDGRLQIGSGGESSWSGDAGGGYGSSEDGSVGRWDLRGGRLFLLEGSGALEPVEFRVEINESDNPFLYIDETEYSRCKD